MKHTPLSLRLNSGWLLLFALPTPMVVYGAMRHSIRLILLGAVLEMVLTVVGLCIMLVRHRRALRAVRAARGRLCLKCGFDLTGLDEQGVCPECGRDYDVWASVKKWRSILHDPRGLDTPPPA